MGMAELKTVGIRELKNKLSAYIREVRAGVRVLVTDRDTVVAELHEPELASVPGGSEDPVLSQWVRSGVVKLARSEKKDLRVSPLRLPDGTSLRLLDEVRGDTPE
jgi:hypothetical protein